jgi:DNA-binding NarL/FixJ family response regulator
MRLAPRELETMRMVAAGKANKEIAALMGVSLSTTRNRISQIYDKLRPLGVKSRVTLGLFYIELIKQSGEKRPSTAFARFNWPPPRK